MVVACIALMVALGGTGYAAIRLPRNSVGSAQIKTGGVKRPDLGRNAVDSSKVAPSSLAASDFAPGQLPQGPPGPGGPPGPQGPAGPAGAAGITSGASILGPAVTNDPGEQDFAGAVCPSDRPHAVGGGVVSEGDFGTQHVNSSFPVDYTQTGAFENGWGAFVDNISPDDYLIHAYVICTKFNEVLVAKRDGKLRKTAP
jgi:hypothetical protein